MGNDNIEKCRFDLLYEVVDAIATMSSATSAFSKARSRADLLWKRVLESPQATDSFKRKIREHAIHSNILREAVARFESSARKLNEEFRRETTGEPIRVENELDVGWAFRVQR